MKKIRNIWLLFFLGFCFYSCKSITESEEIIRKLNPKEARDYIGISEFAEEISILQLKAPDEYPFGWIRQIFIKEKNIYVVDVKSNVVFIFNREGNFLAMLNSIGRGPGEYNRIGPVFVDINETYLETLTYTGEGFGFLRYSIPELVYLGFKPMIPLLIDSGVKVEEVYYLGNHQSINSINQVSSNASLIVLCKDDEVQTYFDYERQIDDLFFSVHRDNFVVSKEGEVFFTRMYDNTFYKINDCSVEPALRVDYGKFGIDNSIHTLPGREQIRYLREAAGLASFPFLKAYNSNLLVISYYFKDRESLFNEPLFRNEDQVHYIEIGSKSKVFHARKIRNDLSDFPPYVFNGPEYRGISYNLVSGEFLIDIILPDNSFRIQPESIGSPQVKGLNHEYDDNSILLVFVKLVP